MFNEKLLLVRNFLKYGCGQNFNTSTVFTTEKVRPFKTYENANVSCLLILKQVETFLRAI